MRMGWTDWAPWSRARGPNCAGGDEDENGKGKDFWMSEMTSPFPGARAKKIRSWIQRIPFSDHYIWIRCGGGSGGEDRKGDDDQFGDIWRLRFHRLSSPNPKSTPTPPSPCPPSPKPNEPRATPTSRRANPPSRNPPGLPPPPNKSTKTPPSHSPRPPMPTRSGDGTTRPGRPTNAQPNCTEISSRV